jgi:hypothetical protein
MEVQAAIKEKQAAKETKKETAKKTTNKNKIIELRLEKSSLFV